MKRYLHTKNKEILIIKMIYPCNINNTKITKIFDVSLVMSPKWYKFGGFLLSDVHILHGEVSLKPCIACYGSYGISYVVMQL